MFSGSAFPAQDRVSSLLLMPSDPPLVSVIVVNHNQRQLLRRCLRSLGAQSFTNFEILVVDNGSTDGSRDLANDPSLLRARWIWNPGNAGFCAAVNQGIEIARGSYIALLNNDAEARPDWLGALVESLERRPAAGMAASKILNGRDPAILDKAGHLIYPDGQNRGRGSGERDRGQYDRVEEVAWPDGCAALYRRELFDHVGGFDEDFFAYGDDAELGLRARIGGWKCVYVPGAIVHHRLGSTLGQYSEQRIFLIERNRVWLAAKLFPWRLLWLNPFYFLLRLVLTAFSALAGRGDAGAAKRSIGISGLLKCIIKAEVAALAGLPAMLRKRREIRSFRRLTPAEVAEVIHRFRLPLADLAGIER